MYGTPLPLHVKLLKNITRRAVESTKDFRGKTVGIVKFCGFLLNRFGRQRTAQFHFSGHQIAQFFGRGAGFDAALEVG